MTFDAVLVGGGLQNALLAILALQDRPTLRIAVVERAAAPCGNHTWSFHASDLSARVKALLQPAIVREWPAYDVRFPGKARRIERPYASISSDALGTLLLQRLEASGGSGFFSGAPAIDVGPSSVRLADGRELTAPVVIDARGPSSRPWAPVQKFLGLEVELARPAALDAPMVMNADVPQRDGFRFVYVLPLSATRLLIEDTYYSDDPVLDPVALRANVLAYAESAGFEVKEVVREERGCLPLPLSYSATPTLESPLVAGFRGGLLHPTTGYTFPIAARFAEVIAAHLPSLPSTVELSAFWSELEPQARFCAALNRLLFRAVEPSRRWEVLKRFHELPADTIERFYALKMTRADRARILLGRPPGGVSLRRAFTQLWGTGANA